MGAVLMALVISAWTACGQGWQPPPAAEQGPGGVRVRLRGWVIIHQDGKAEVCLNILESDPPQCGGGLLVKNVKPDDLPGARFYPTHDRVVATSGEASVELEGRLEDDNTVLVVDRKPRVLEVRRGRGPSVPPPPPRTEETEETRRRQGEVMDAVNAAGPELDRQGLRILGATFEADGLLHLGVLLASEEYTAEATRRFGPVVLEPWAQVLPE